MAFRDDRGAMRARVEELEDELAQAKHELQTQKEPPLAKVGRSSALAWIPIVLSVGGLLAAAVLGAGGQQVLALVLTIAAVTLLWLGVMVLVPVAIAALVELLYPPEFRASVRLEVLSERMNGGLERRAHPRTLRAQLLAILRHDTRRRLRGIQVPSLVIKPERDLLVRPRHSDLLAARIPRARKLDLPDGGHGAVFQCADRVNAALLAHFAAAEQGEQE